MEHLTVYETIIYCKIILGFSLNILYTTDSRLNVILKGYEMNNEKKMLTVKETTERMRISQRTVFNYIERGLLKPVKLGGIKKTGKNLIPVEQIENLLEQR